MIYRAKEFMNYNLHLDLSLDDISNELDILDMITAALLINLRYFLVGLP